MTEILVVVSEAPEGGFVATGVDASIVRRQIRLKTYAKRLAMRCDAATTRQIAPR
jgi:hypothetical protein